MGLSNIINCSYNWFGAWVALADNLVVLVTLGCITPGWEFEYICWRTIHQLRKHKIKRNK